MFRLEQHLGDPLLLPPDLSVVIGRGIQCDLQLIDPAASRVHCRVIATKGKVTLTDVGSRWGTFVNGQRVEQCDLRHGDQITVGKTMLWLVVEGHPEQMTLAPKSELQRPGKISYCPEYPSGCKLSDSQTADEIPEINLNPEVTGNEETWRKYGSRHPEILHPAGFLGKIFHRYRPQQILASTSTGVVFRAAEETTGQTLALKIFHTSSFTDKRAEQRFEGAVRTTVGQQHPNIVELLNAGKWNGSFFTASKFVEGESAVDLIRRIGVAGMLDPGTVVQIARDICNALLHLEAKHIVHRNIMPTNILISKCDRVALLNDLIAAKAFVSDKYGQLTQPGTISGNVAYMSPELLGSGYPTDCRSDIYQLGATLYALLTGRPPFENGPVTEMLTCIMETQPKSVQIYHMSTPARLDDIVQKMLKKNPRERFQNAAELSLSLEKMAAELDQKNFKTCAIDPKAIGWQGAMDEF